MDDDVPMGELPADLAERLYAVPPEGFVAARDAAVATVRRRADTRTAAALATLRRPTLAAWMVNQLVRRHPAEVDELLALGEELRAAQRHLHGDELRRLTRCRRELLGLLVDRARELAREAGRSRVERLPLAEVEETLTAALCDPRSAEEVRTGRLTRALAYSGFGEVPRPRLQVIAGGRSETGGSRAGEEAGEDATEVGAGAFALPGGTGSGSLARIVPVAPGRAGELARSVAEQVESELERADTAEREARRMRDALGAELAELAARHAEAEAELTRAELARRSAERLAGRARRRLGGTDGLRAARRG